MSIFQHAPPDEAEGRRITFGDPAPVSLGALDYLPGVALVRQEANLVGDLIDGDRRASMAELYAANDEAQTFIDNTFAREDARREAYRRRIERIHAATGVQLQMPLDGTGSFAAVDRPVGSEWEERYGGDPIGRRNLEAFRRQLAELRGKFPQHAELFDSDFDGDTGGIVSAAEARRKAADAGAADLSGISRLASVFAGGGRGMLRDPVQIAALFLGGGAGTAKGVVGRIGQTILTEAAVNAGVEAAVQTRAQAWRAENGLESGIVPGLRQVGLAGLFGGTFGGLIAGGREVARAFRVTDAAEVAAIERVATGNPREGDLDQVAKRLGVRADAAETRVAAVADAQAALDDAAFGPTPAGLTDDEAAAMRNAAVRSAETDGPPAAGPVAKPRRDPAEHAVLSEALPGGAISVRGRPVGYERFDPETVGTDAVAYQYKGGGDDAGVTDRLRGVKRWDPTASGKVMIHERTDGARFIADGHQRLGLARRLKAEGDASVRLDGYLFREADGWTAEDVRALAAKKNMQEGSGEAIDAARVMRDRPDLLDDGLPMSGAMMRRASALARLSDDAWGMAINGVVDQNHAALIGELVPDPRMHAAAIRDLAEFSPETDRAARMLLEEIMASGVRHETQTDMFGAFDLSKSLIGERVKVMEAAQRVLRQDKRLFAMLGDRADVIEAAGNTLDAAGNATRAVTAETVEAIVDRMARTKGPVSDALTEAARRFAGGSNATREARLFIGDIQSAIEREGLPALLNPPEPQLAAARAAEPGTAEAEAMAGLFPDEPARRAPPSRVLDVEPIGQGPAGPIYPASAFDGSWTAAVDFLTTRQAGDIAGMLSHPDVGRIDVVWGGFDAATDNGLGLAKIVAKHPEVLDELPSILASMDVKTRSANRIVLESKVHKAVVRLDYDGEAKTWLMTAYEKDERGLRAKGTTGRPDGLQTDRSSASQAEPNIIADEVEGQPYGQGALSGEGNTDPLEARSADDSPKFIGRNADDEDIFETVKGVRQVRGFDGVFTMEDRALSVDDFGKPITITFDRSGTRWEVVTAPVEEARVVSNPDVWDVVPDGTDAEGRAQFARPADLLERAGRDDDLGFLVEHCKV
ncbi:hypothetical protein D3218_00375 [Aureimonas flava]|uniref:Phage-Barnase-EndoU-ColicinE5/D-RelE-like nuclease domain-containing protein n=1 Tax=Aureimonas flava TaxID=2320271 RepID=A0A3A1WQC9_9HYPH|nr:hypothetical protein [Aureimonas flava]RIY03266.1 hypothetical protein D3218_00375 [Aureimonas flava]